MQCCGSGSRISVFSGLPDPEPYTAHTADKITQKIDSKESIPPAYVAWRAGTTTPFYSVAKPP
jgi:hypothetical protein